MSDLLLLSWTATEAMDNENMIKMMIHNKGSSPTTMGVLPMLGQRPFVFDSSLQQAANVTLVAMQEEAWQEAAQSWHTGRLLAGRTGAFGNSVPNISQGNNEDAEGQAKPHGIIIPTFILDGKFTKACLHLGSSKNLVKVVDTTCQLFAAWFSEDMGIGCMECIQRIGDQLTPFPLFSVNESYNTACVLHGVKKSTAAFDMSHPNEGNNLTFMSTFTQVLSTRPTRQCMEIMAWNLSGFPSGPTPVLHIF